MRVNPAALQANTQAALPAQAQPTPGQTTQTQPAQAAGQPFMQGLGMYGNAPTPQPVVQPPAQISGAAAQRLGLGFGAPRPLAQPGLGGAMSPLQMLRSQRSMMNPQDFRAQMNELRQMQRQPGIGNQMPQVLPQQPGLGQMPPQFPGPGAPAPFNQANLPQVFPGRFPLGGMPLGSPYETWQSPVINSTMSDDFVGNLQPAQLAQSSLLNRFQGLLSGTEASPQTSPSAGLGDLAAQYGMM